MNEVADEVIVKIEELMFWVGGGMSAIIAVAVGYAFMKWALPALIDMFKRTASAGDDPDAEWLEHLRAAREDVDRWGDYEDYR